MERQTDLGHYRPISEMPFEWRFPGGPIVAHFEMLTGRQTDRQDTNRSQHWLQSCQTHHNRLYKHQILERFQRLDQNLQHLFHLRVCRWFTDTAKNYDGSRLESRIILECKPENSKHNHFHCCWADMLKILEMCQCDMDAPTMRKIFFCMGQE